MPTNTYVELQKVTVGTATNSITFSSINQGYTDLVLVVSGRSSRTADEYEGLGIRFNSDTGSNYSATTLAGTGGAASSFRALNQTNIESRINTSVSSNTAPSANTIQIQNYSNTTTNKTVLIRSNSSVEFYRVTATVGLWRNTAAITSITLYPTQLGSQFTAGSTFSLYGIKANTNSESSAKATGGYVSEDSTYWYHAFPYTGTFTPNQSLTADILVIAGGGGGGCDWGGGGGAGGLLLHSSQSLSATNYTVTIGAGGATTTTSQSQGGNSQFGALTASVGGGFGGARAENNGGSGGSGGGSSYSGFDLGGTGTAGQGNAGGNLINVGGIAGGSGGGGAGGAGGGRNVTSGGTGGAGLSTYSSWGIATGLGQDISGTRWFAGGGGGSLETTGFAGGNGGGGKGGQISPYEAVAGISATGGGGGGAGGANLVAGGTGGSGLVIVRYAK